MDVHLTERSQLHTNEHHSSRQTREGQSIVLISIRETDTSWELIFEPSFH